MTSVPLKGNLHFLVEYQHKQDQSNNQHLLVQVIVDKLLDLLIPFSETGVMQTTFKL